MNKSHRKKQFKKKKKKQVCIINKSTKGTENNPFNSVQSEIRLKEEPELLYEERAVETIQKQSRKEV